MAELARLRAAYEARLSRYIARAIEDKIRADRGIRPDGWLLQSILAWLALLSVGAGAWLLSR